MTDKKNLTHIDKQNQPTMVDVGDKQATRREAEAVSVLEVPAAVAELFDGNEMLGPKGPVFQTAIIAGTMAVKKTAELIPFCHPLPIDGCKIRIQMEGSRIEVRCKVKVFHKTGVEMEALTGASVAALTIYDMCKAVSHEIVIRDTRLLSKSGGKRDVSA